MKFNWKIYNFLIVHPSLDSNKFVWLKVSVFQFIWCSFFSLPLKLFFFFWSSFAASFQSWWAGGRWNLLTDAGGGRVMKWLRVCVSESLSWAGSVTRNRINGRERKRYGGWENEGERTKERGRSGGPGGQWGAERDSPNVSRDRCYRGSGAPPPTLTWMRDEGRKRGRQSVQQRVVLSSCVYYGQMIK